MKCLFTKAESNVAHLISQKVAIYESSSSCEPLVRDEYLDYILTESTSVKRNLVRLFEKKNPPYREQLEIKAVYRKKRVK